MANTTGKKFGGRQKGTPNKKTEALRAKVEMLINDNWETLLKDIQKLESKERVNTFIKLLEYSLPKLNRTEISDMTTVEEIISMTPEERSLRISYLREKINKIS